MRKKVAHAVLLALLVVPSCLFAEQVNLATLRATVLDIEITNTSECFLQVTTGIDPFCVVVPEVGNDQCETIEVGDCMEISGQVMDGDPTISVLCPDIQVSGNTWLVVSPGQCD